jgi:MoaD family protein
LNVTVKAFADMRELLGAELAVPVPERAVVRELLQILGTRSPAFLPRILDDFGELKPYVNILKGGRNIRMFQGLDTELTEGDVIAIFPPVAGG